MRLKKNEKVSKGYRLRPKTHKMICRIQKLLNADYDDTLTKICLVFMKSEQFQSLKNSNLESEL